MEKQITLATLEQATEQEVFDHVARHLLKQGRRSGDERDCLYRHGDLKCAAGCLIADGEYDKDFENTSWTRLVEREQVPEAHQSLIQALQNIHDVRDTEEWPDYLREVADGRGLSPAAIEEFQA